MTHAYPPAGPPAAADGTGPCRTRIDLHTPVPDGLASEIERRLYFVSPEISGFELVTEGGEVRGVTLLSQRPLARAAVADKVNRLVDADVRKQWPTAPKSVWTSPHRRTVEDGGTFARLAETGAVSAVGEGQVALGEPLLSLLAYFDRAVKGLLARHFTAAEYRYPTLISTRALETAGYFASFPHHLMFVTRLHNDIDVYEEFRAAYGGKGIDAAVLASCRNVDYCLPPTMCYHTFHQYSGRNLEAGRVHVVTSRGKSFRYEAAYATTLERLWDFTIREIVFFGPRDAVLAARETFMRTVFDYATDLGLSGFCEVGNDPFFCAADTSERIWSQRLMELKYELRLDVAPDRSIAVGSFNFHDDLFGRGFGIDQGDDGPVRSACVGFGLERLVYAFLCQFGADPDGWPDAVRAGTAGGGGA
ncbi:hypothetical protein [Streptomyces sp. NPDC018045]|uniref:hypothetical protein n=1 Tax=Streptomyces sp. NPDC018045 TaxID=3365037 RepID=UPI003797863C